MIDTAGAVALVLLAVGALGCAVRVVRGPSLADRVVALDAFVMIVVCGVAVQAARVDSDRFLDAVLVATLIGFISTVTVARFVERRGAR